MTRSSAGGKTLVELLTVLAIMAILGSLLLGRGGCMIGCGEGYSTGERTGTIVKCGYKGIFSSTKSWEAEMNLGGLTTGADGRVMANVWKFTIENDEVLEKVRQAQEKQLPVTIKYTEWLCRPGCRSDSGYFATDVRFLEIPKAKESGK